MSGARTPKNLPPTRQQADRRNTANDALHGASSAFSKPHVKPKPNTDVTSSLQGALLAAATLVGKAEKDLTADLGLISPLAQPLLQEPRLSQQRNQSSLEVPHDGAFDRSRSPSNVAASLAATRYTPQPLPPRPPRSPMLQHLANTSKDGARSTSESAGLGKAQPRTMAADTAAGLSISPSKATDTTSLAPTTALVQMFEKGSGKSLSDVHHSSGLSQQVTLPPLRSPKPLRKARPTLLRAADVASSSNVISKANEPKKMDSRETMLQPSVRKAPKEPNDVQEKPELPVRPNPSAETEPPPISVPEFSTKRVSKDDSEVPSPSAYTSASEAPTVVVSRSKSMLPPPRRGRAKGPGNDPVSPALKSRSFDGSNSARGLRPAPASSSPRVHSVSPPQSIGRSSMDLSGTSNYQRESIRRITPHMTGDKLANAMVASALATSRPSSVAPTPTRSPEPAAMLGYFHTPNYSKSPSPNPSKPLHMRKTLRKELSSSDEEDERTTRRHKRHGYLMRKHPNKHHEGDRKRWRDKITPRERKRYEGLWATNRGLLIDNQFATNHPSSAAKEGRSEDDVLNIVVRDIWSRSRLPSHVLEEIWDLVDSREVGSLGRDAFVVGLWLVDQRLKGRKLPPRVSNSVWESARGLGLRVRKVH